MTTVNLISSNKQAVHTRLSLHPICAQNDTQAWHSHQGTVIVGIVVIGIVVVLVFVSSDSLAEAKLLTTCFAGSVNLRALFKYSPEIQTLLLHQSRKPSASGNVPSGSGSRLSPYSSMRISGGLPKLDMILLLPVRMYIYTRAHTENDALRASSEGFVK